MGRFLFFILLILLLYYILDFLIRGIPHLKRKIRRESEPEELVQDPCCHTYVPKRSAVKKKIGGSLFYFCNEECWKRYVNK